MKNSLQVLLLRRFAIVFLIALAMVMMEACQQVPPPTEPVTETPVPESVATTPAPETVVSVPVEGVCDLPGPDQTKIEAFIKNQCYLVLNDWASEEKHLSGREVDGVYYTVHDSIEIYYSPDVERWRKGERGQIPNNGMIVALEYDPETTGDAPIRAQSMVRSQDDSYDGWFWSTTDLADNSTQGGGQFGDSGCLSCHATADNDWLIFSMETNQVQPTADWTPDKSLLWPASVPQVTRTLPQPLATADLAFLEYYQLPDVRKANVQPFPPKTWDHVVAGVNFEDEGFITAEQCAGCHSAGQKLPNTRPNMWTPDPDPEAADPSYRDFSPYAEWSASINGLSGRDPIWHAQVEFERRLRPELDEFTFATCFVCHGAMAGRQLSIDNPEKTPFDFNQRDYLYESPDQPMGKYAALARDGVSCTVCHSISAEGLGVDPNFVLKKINGVETGGVEHLNIDQLNTYTAQFKTDTTFYSPHEEPVDGSMVKSFGRGTEQAAHLSQSKLCGSCHTVIVPALSVRYGRSEGVGQSNPFEDSSVKMSFEQTTYFEWRNSAYENEINDKNANSIQCQGCHMPAHEGHVNSNIESNLFPPVNGRVADPQIDIQPRTPYYRHVLLGINRFVFGMYQQFTDLLGAQHIEADVPEQTLNPLLNAEDWISDHAKNESVDLRIIDLRESNDNIEVDLEVTTFTGHKFPTGAGFRRAFIYFEVLDANDNLMWASGQFNNLGVLVDQTGTPLATETTTDPASSHPHYQVITSQDQVQVYETRALDSEHMLQGTVLGIWEEYKDNRILPLGWNPVEDPEGPSRNLYAMRPRLRGSDNEGAPPDAPAYCNTDDELGHLGYDPDYCSAEGAGNGQDHITYRVPLSSIQGWAQVRARIYYQSIPPYFLRNLFQSGVDDKSLSEGPDVQRAYYIASRLNLADSPAENWSEMLGSPAILDKGGTPSLPLTRADIMEKQADWHLQYRNSP